MRQWNKYFNQQLYSECQLVTALNAYYYLTGKVYCQQKSSEYESLVDLCKARHGSAISIEKIYKKLGLKVLKTFDGLSDYKHLRKFNNLLGFKQLPVEISVWEKHYGFHSVCVVDYIKKCDALRITNFRYATSLDGWVFEEDFKMYVNERISQIKLFGLKC